MNLTEKSICPVCNSNDITEGEGFSKNLETGDSYLVPTLKYFKINQSSFLNSNRIYSCKKCYAIWISPWLTILQSKRVFDSIKSNHQAGWDQFEYALKNKYPNYYMKWVAELIVELKMREVPFSNYAELGCPFSGFSLLHGFPEGRNKAIYSMFRPKENGSLWLKIDQLLNGTSKFVLYVLSYLNKIRIQYHNVGMINRTLITVNTSQGWGVSCVRMNRSCAGASLDTKLFDQTINLNNIPDDIEPKYDLIGIFNYFDHLDKPLIYIDKLQKISNNILICTHAPNSIGWQHKFGFDYKFVDFLQSKYPSKKITHVSTLKDKLGTPKDFCFLIQSQ